MEQIWIWCLKLFRSCSDLLAGISKVGMLSNFLNIVNPLTNETEIKL